MSIFGDKEKPRLVGAKEKREKAMAYSGSHEVKSKKEGPQSGPAATIILIWLLSLAGAFFLRDVNLHSGIAILDEIFGGDSLLSVSASRDINLFATTALRGTVIFFFSGILPLMSYCWEKILDRGHTHPYYIVWGMTASLGLLFFLLRDFILPAVSDVTKIITG